MFSTSELGIIGVNMLNSGFPLRLLYVPTSLAYAESYMVKGGAPDRTASPEKKKSVNKTCGKCLWCRHPWLSTLCLKQF